MPSLSRLRSSNAHPWPHSNMYRKKHAPADSLSDSNPNPSPSLTHSQFRSLCRLDYSFSPLSVSIPYSFDATIFQLAIFNYHHWCARSLAVKRFDTPPPIPSAVRLPAPSVFSPCPQLSSRSGTMRCDVGYTLALAPATHTHTHARAKNCCFTTSSCICPPAAAVMSHALPLLPDFQELNPGGFMFLCSAKAPCLMLHSVGLVPGDPCPLDFPSLAFTPSTREKAMCTTTAGASESTHLPNHVL